MIGSRVALCLALAISAYAEQNDEYVSVRGSYKGELGKKLDEYMQNAEKAGYSGSILVERNGEIVIASGYGWANRDKKQLFTKDTVIDIGSITKQFTATGIMKLQEAGKLNVQDPMSKYLPNVPIDKQGITLHHLLTHSSGMKDVFGDDYELILRDDFVKTALASTLLWEPGAKYRYSNAGYSILGAIIEVVSGEPFEEYLHNQLFKPAGMQHTGYLIPKWDRETLVHQYKKDKDWGTMLDHPWLPDGPGWHLRCNGGMMSTLEDLRLWHHALLENTVLSKASKDLIFAPHVRESENGDSYYGYGWVTVQTKRGTRLIMHNGGNDIFMTDFRRYVDDDTLFLMSSTVAEHKLGSVERGALEIIFPPAKLP